MNPLYKYEVKKECGTKIRIGRRQFAEIRYRVGETLFLNPEANETKSWLNKGYIQRLDGAPTC